MAHFWGRQNVCFYVDFSTISGPDFSWSRRKFLDRGGPKMSIFGHFWPKYGFSGPPQNPEISGKFPSGFTAVWGPKKWRYPLFKILAALERNRKSRIFRFLRESALFAHFWAHFGPHFGHFWPFYVIFHIFWGGPDPPILGEREKPRLGYPPQGTPEDQDMCIRFAHQ